MKCFMFDQTNCFWMKARWNCWVKAARRVWVLQKGPLFELDSSDRFVNLDKHKLRTWKDGLRVAVRNACDELGIQRRGVHGFRGTAAGECVRVKEMLGL